MPYGDRTGPMGLGPMTGRGMGFCTGYNSPGYANPTFRRDQFVRGGGRGWRNWYYATGRPGWLRNTQGLPAWGKLGYYPFFQPTVEEEKRLLEDNKKILQRELQTIEKRLKELKDKSKTK